MLWRKEGREQPFKHLQPNVTQLHTSRRRRNFSFISVELFRWSDWYSMFICQYPCSMLSVLFFQIDNPSPTLFLTPFHLPAVKNIPKTRRPQQGDKALQTSVQSVCSMCTCVQVCALRLRGHSLGGCMNMLDLQASTNS